LGNKENDMTDVNGTAEMMDEAENAAEPTFRSRALAAIPASGIVRGIIPQTFEDAYRIAKVIHASGLAPYGLNSPDKVMIAIMHGMEVGLPPMAALQSIAVINGRPSIYGDGLLGLIRKSGLLVKFKEWSTPDGFVPPKELKDWPDEVAAICMMQRRGEDPLTVQFSVGTARAAGLWMKRGNNGQDTPWITYPMRMLKMRARAFCGRDLFADVIKGLHVAEEAMDMPIVEQPPLTSGLSERLPGVNKVFSPDSVKATIDGKSAEIDEEVTETSTDDRLPAEAVDAIKELRKDLRSAKTELEVGAAWSFVRPSFERMGGAALIEANDIVERKLANVRKANNK
jgi:hypothetical protein